MGKREHIETRVCRMECLLSEAEAAIRSRYLRRAALTAVLTTSCALLAAAAYTHWML